ncbi:hypothetical protein MmiEs2_03560 [Methanimicrococcus stummii]|uniref:Uncharacterized protein n=1 Tax=Methanimicrococcus stummii TaxID=3028294 RepID=A0AA96ZWT0_9EURY|nr:hypothetical protein MmiEs2_03560 [Methanimicrococcus sp. Es2]
MKNSKKIDLTDILLYFAEAVVLNPKNAKKKDRKYEDIEN